MFEQIRTVLEFLYFISGIVLAIFAGYGIKQIRLMKADIRTRSERAAKEKAIETASDYLNGYVRLDGLFRDWCINEKIPYVYKGPIRDFTLESIPKNLIKTSAEKHQRAKWLPAINKLESIAAIFTTGVGDEKVGFQIIGRSYCGTVANYYDILSINQLDKVNTHHRDIVKLFNIWSPRLSKSELIKTREDLDEHISALPDTSIPTINPNID
jgi:hypothetical protein